jgi:hypothetical protein
MAPLAEVYILAVTAEYIQGLALPAQLVQMLVA